MNLLDTIAGLALGFGLASAAYLRTFTRHLRALHQDNVETADKLKHSDTHLTRKVEEQNMTALSARLDEMEEEADK